MNHTRFLILTLPAACILAAAALFLPENIVEGYISVIEPLALAAGGILAILIARMYRREMRRAFVYFAVFLFIYGATIASFRLLETSLSGDVYSWVIVGIQVIDYVFLILFCINLLKVVRITGLSPTAKSIIGATAVLCTFLALYTPLAEGLGTVSVRVIVYLIIRLVDAALVTVLVPLIWLYIAYLKSRQQQSLTFTVIISGIVCATIFNYIYEAVVSLFASGGGAGTAVPEALFIFGFFVIVIGLYAHRKDEQWGFDAVDRFMSGEIDFMKSDDE